MGFLSAYSGTRTIPVGPPDGDYWVKIKECLSSGDKEKADQALTSGKLVPGQQKAEMSMNVVKFRQLMVQASIIDWNLDDESGKIWPIDLAHVRKLPAPIFDQLYKEIDAANAPATKEEKLTFRPEGAGGSEDGDAGAPDTGDVQP